MKVFIVLASLAALSIVQAKSLSSIHLRVHQKGSKYTITNESQCDGQNWTGSTCCADPSYECRWDDDGADVMRCQRIVTEDDDDATDDDANDECASEIEDSEEKESEEDEDEGDGGDEECTIINESQCDGQNWTGSTCCADPNHECRWDDDGANVMRCQQIEVAEDRRHHRHHHKQLDSKKRAHQKRHHKNHE